ncbi:hypothetical protein [uncultured Kordia sp.]|uniref:hypothetical protein n=1 Tax=uncultured Kordia sp. TaxID=507699 RepID=UPI002631555D|nr:hypothetical protein [uncultured Kordia sp.]
MSIFFVSCDFFGRKQVKADGYRNISIKNSTFAIEYWLGSHPDAEDKDSYHLYIKNDSVQYFKDVLKDFFSKTYDPKTVQAVTIYTDTIFNTTDVTLNPPNISGIQVHYIEDSHLQTKVYNHKNDQLQQIDDLNSFVDYFSPKDVHDTSKIFNDATNSIFILVNSEISSEYETGKSNYDKNLADYKLKNN